MITKNTIVGMSVGTFIAVLGALWVASGEVQGYITQISLNTQAIQGIVTSLELSRIDRQIENFRKERRELKRDLRSNSNDVLLLEQIDELNDAIEAALLVRECIIDPNKKVCK